MLAHLHVAAPPPPRVVSVGRRRARPPAPLPSKRLVEGGGGPRAARASGGGGLQHAHPLLVQRHVRLHEHQRRVDRRRVVGRREERRGVAAAEAAEQLVPRGGGDLEAARVGEHFHVQVEEDDDARRRQPHHLPLEQRLRQQARPSREPAQLGDRLREPLLGSRVDVHALRAGCAEGRAERRLEALREEVDAHLLLRRHGGDPDRER